MRFLGAKDYSGHVEIYHISERVCAFRSSAPKDDLSTDQAFNDLRSGLRGSHRSRAMTDSATRAKEEKMKMLPQVLFWLGLISVPFAWLVWYFGSEIEIIKPVLASISDPALRAALQEAHAERLGIWVAVWPVSFLVLSQILEKKMQG
jgi:hypothetical protein